MPDFDPIDLGSYVPQSMIPIKEGANAILSGFVQAQYAYTENLLENNDLSEDERKELSFSLQTVPSLRASYQMQEWSWSVLRDRLVTEEIEAFALDEERRLYPLKRKFWLSEYGNVSLSSGVILPIPLFEPRDEVVISRNTSDDLFRKFYDDTFNGMDPPYHKLPSLVVAPLSMSVDIEGNNYEVRKGAKLKFDVEIFLHEAFALIYDANPMPKTQADLGRRAADAYEAKGGKGGRPSEPWVRATIAKLWRRLDLGQE